MTTGASHSAKRGIGCPLCQCPARPDSELTNTKAAETAATCRVMAHRLKSITGVRKIPPPVPVIPASPPSKPPVTNATAREGKRGRSGSGSFQKRRTAEKISTTPNNGFSISPGIRHPPATYAIGTDATANGQNNRHEKYPARANCAVATTATPTFQTNATGLISAGAIPLKANTATYPEAPA